LRCLSIFSRPIPPIVKSAPSKSLSFLVWGGLGILIAVLVALLALEKSGRLGKPVPVYESVPSFSLTNQLGEVVSNDSLRGKVWVTDIVFSRCPLQCMKMSREMKALRDSFAGVQELRFVSLTADPDYDTPSILARYGALFSANPDNWLFLTGPKREIVRVAVDGLKLVVLDKPPAERESPEDLFLHSTFFVLVDQKGRIRGWFDLQDPEVKTRLQQSIRQVLKGR
jgi:protein SCO1/2